jgi:hypothetical protein
MKLHAPLLAVALALTPAVSFAQPANPEAQARTAFERGIADVDAGRFASAVAAFEESYRLRPVAVVLFNLAGAYSRMGRHQQSIATYERYLAEGTRLPPERVQSVRDRIAELRREMPVVVLCVRPAPFTLTVDGRPQAVTGDELALDPGSHILVVSAPSRAPQQREVQLSPGARITWDAELVAENTAAPTAPVVVATTPAVTAPAVVTTPHPAGETPVTPRESSPGITSRWWFWTGLGVVVAGGTVLALGLSGTFDTTQAPVPGTAYDVSAVRW